MLPLLLALSLCASASPVLDSVVVGPQSADSTDALTEAAISAAAGEIHGREVFLKKRVEELAATCKAGNCPDEAKRAAKARLLLLVQVNSLGTKAVVSTKVLDALSAKVLEARATTTRKATALEVKEAVRAHVREIFTALRSVPLPPPTRESASAAPYRSEASGPDVPEVSLSKKMGVVVEVDASSALPTVPPGVADQAAWLASTAVATIDAEQGWDGMLPDDPAAQGAPRKLRLAVRSFGDEAIIVVELSDRESKTVLANATESASAAAAEATIKKTLKAALFSGKARDKVVTPP